MSVNNRYLNVPGCRSQWPRCLRHKSAAARLLGMRVRIPPRVWESLSCECCLLSGRGLCFGLITRPESPIDVFVCECDRVVSMLRRTWLIRGYCAMEKNYLFQILVTFSII